MRLSSLWRNLLAVLPLAACWEVGFATGAVRLPVFVKGFDSQQVQTASEINKRLAGRQTLPEYVELSTRGMNHALDQLEQHVKGLTDKLFPGESMELMIISDLEELTKQPHKYSASHRTCFVGSPIATVEVLSNLADSMLSDMFEVAAVRTGAGFEFNNVPAEEQDHYRSYSAAQEAWSAAPEADNDKMLLYYYDSEADVPPSLALIPRCK